MGLVYRFEGQIPFYETDVNHQVRLPYLLELALHVSGLQSQALGVSDDWLFEHYGLVWVVVEHQLTIDRLPVFGENIRIETELVGYNRYLCYRIFRIFGEDGKLCVTIDTSFALIAFETRQLTPLPMPLLEKYGHGLEKLVRKRLKWRTLTAGQDKKHAVGYFDLDRNGHVTNSRYLEWVYDDLPLDFHKQYLPKQLTIRYLKEIQADQQVLSRLQVTDVMSQHDVLADGQLQAQVLVTWQKRHENGGNHDL